MGAGRAWRAAFARDAGRRRHGRPRRAARHPARVGPRACGIGRGGDRAPRAGGRVLLAGGAFEPGPGGVAGRVRRGPRDDGLRGPVSRRSAAAEEHRARRRRRLLPGAARRDQLLAPVVVGEPGARAPERAGFLRGVPHPRLRMSLVPAALSAVTALIALHAAASATPSRAAYILPVCLAAVSFLT